MAAALAQRIFNSRVYALWGIPRSFQWSLEASKRVWEHLESILGAWEWFCLLPGPLSLHIELLAGPHGCCSSTENL